MVCENFWCRVPPTLWAYISGFWAALGWWFLFDALFYDSLVRATGKETGVVLAMEVKKKKKIKIN